MFIIRDSYGFRDKYFHSNKIDFFKDGMLEKKRHLTTPSQLEFPNFDLECDIKCGFSDALFMSMTLFTSGINICSDLI